MIIIIMKIIILMITINNYKSINMEIKNEEKLKFFLKVYK